MFITSIEGPRFPLGKGAMGWIRRLRTLPLRGKVAVTFVGVVALVLAISAYLSFRYWQREFLAASEQQASLAAASTRAALESTLPTGRVDAGRRSLARVASGAPVSAARLYGPSGAILLSSNLAEEGRRPGGVWIPSASELPRRGVLKQTASGDTVHAFVPVSLDAEGDAVLELVLSVEAVKSAMERGALLGNGLMLLSFVALGLILVTMLEREVVSPLHRMEDELVTTTGTRAGAGDEVTRIQTSVQHLIEKEREAEERAEKRSRELAAKEGFAEVGELAAEMAHEFKRPLASIRTAIDLLEQEYELREGGQDVLGEVDHQLERLSETMRDLFALAKPVAMERAPLELADTVDDALVEARCLGESPVDVVRRYDAELPDVEGDAHRLEQAFQNVICNAVEAMSEGGVLTVRIIALDTRTVEVSFEDTGAGIPPDEIDRALRPFYSTKPLGTGLGLPLVARIVSAHRGRLALESTPGEGTTVRITLPVTRPLSEDDPEASEWHLSGSSSSTTTS